MIGESVPLVMIPRFTSYVGGLTDYTTVPLDVSEFTMAWVTFWRGPLVGDTGNGAKFEAWFEVSQDAQTWEKQPPSPFVINTPDTWDSYSVGFSRRWFRMKVRLTPDTDDIVAITCWAVGSLERRTK